MVRSKRTQRPPLPIRVARYRAPLTVLATLVIVITVAGQRAVFPLKLESYLDTAAARLSADERQLFVAGQPVTKLLDADESKEVAIFGAVWIAAPMRRYVEAVRDIEQFERGGGFKVTKRISTPPRLADFDLLRIRDEVSSQHYVSVT
jgi:hypothetical protein